MMIMFITIIIIVSPNHLDAQVLMMIVMAIMNLMKMMMVMMIMAKMMIMLFMLIIISTNHNIVLAMRGKQMVDTWCRGVTAEEREQGSMATA